MPAAPTLTGLTVGPLAPLSGPQHLRASVNQAGITNGNALGGDISADGRYVVFISTASNLVAGDNNGVADIFRKDLWTGVVELVSATTAGVIGNGISGQASGSAGVGATNWSLPSISENGRYVGFVSAAQNLPGAVAGIVSGYAKDMTTGALFNLSQPLATSLRQTSVETLSVSMGAAGIARVVVDPVSVLSPEIWRVSVAPGYAYTAGVQGVLPVPQFYGTVFGYGREPPTLAGDIVGWNVPTTRILSFSLANNPSLGDSNGLGDVMLTAPGGTRVISRQLVGPGGGPPEQSNQASYPGFLSLDGRVATFYTDAVNIESGATAGPDDGLIRSDWGTVWAFVDPSAASIAARAAAIAENRTAEVTFGMGDAARFSLSWGDKTVVSGGTGGASTLSVAKTYAANGTYTLFLKLDGPGGSTTDPTRLHLLARDAAAVVTGAGYRDIVFAGDRADVIHGRGGDDVVHAGAGDDTLTGGAGADTLFGEGGDDVFVDGPGLAFADLYVGGAGLNRISYAGVREAMEIALSGEPLEFGAAKAGYASVITPGGRVTDLIYDIAMVIGGDANNTIYGSEDADTLVGGRGADLIQGGAGDDLIQGGMGRDTLRGNGGSDTLEGGPGDDLLIVTGGQAVANGGSGRNSLFFEYDSSVEDSVVWHVDMLAGRATRADGASLSFSGITEIGGDRGLEVLGSTAGEVFLLGRYASVFTGGGGFDTLSARNAVIGALMDASAVDGIARLGAGNLEGGGGLTGFSGIRGFEGGAGADTLIGSRHADRIAGGEGDDVLEGGGGADSLTGGAGQDAFVLGLSGAADRLIDFTPGTDLIWLSEALFGLPAGPLDPASLTLGAVALGGLPVLVFDAAAGLLSWDADGNGAGAATPLAILPAGVLLSAADVLIA
jgi:Ca2+-binding RTX toxin-like protein